MQQWFKEVIVYQIYLRSFFDSNQDGIGDLPGVMAKLDYLAELGVDVIWLSPFCKSPNQDNGYDVADYYQVMKEYGELEDFQCLVQETKRRGMKIMMDLVLNHTSDQHPWFLEALADPNSPKRDYYHWVQAKSGKELPNNWDSYFGGAAWTYDSKSEAYYLHHFTKYQPDLNWENLLVREEIKSMVEWWIGQGVEAFRLDAIHQIGKPAGYPDAPLATEHWPFCNYCNTKETHQYLHELAREVFLPHEVMTVGETGGTSPETAALYVNQAREELQMIFHFDHLGLKEFSAAKLRACLVKWYQALSPNGWDAVVFNNHDYPRQISAQKADGKYRREAAKAYATLLLTLWGTPYIYQGEEIGMTNVCYDSLEDYRDPVGIIEYQRALEKGMSPKQAWAEFVTKTRDNSRTPMQWDDSLHSGFTKGKPWMKVNPNYQEINVAREDSDPDSVLNYYKRLIQLRKAERDLVTGDFRAYGAEHQQVLAYTRNGVEKSFLVIVNLSELEVEYQIAPDESKSWEEVLTNYPAKKDDFSAKMLLSPWEARIYQVHNKN